MISIVIPAHNEEKYIGRTLRAVLDLDYPDFEVIVIDNASTDNTSAIAKSFPGVKVFFEKQKGTQFARERGRVESKGEIIAGIDADCIPDRDWLKNGVVYFNDPNVVAVSGPYYYYDTGWFFRSVSLFIQRTYAITNDILQFFHHGAVLIGGNWLIRASAMEKIGGHDTSFVFYGDDTDTAKRLSKVGKIIFSTKFVMQSSGRRFENIGLLRTLYNYALGFLRVTLKKN
jgi:glycosyltransferase involved in cell wall biosynthesis